MDNLADGEILIGINVLRQCDRLIAVVWHSDNLKNLLLLCRSDWNLVRPIFNHVVSSVVGLIWAAEGVGGWECCAGKEVTLILWRGSALVLCLRWVKYTPFTRLSLQWSTWAHNWFRDNQIGHCSSCPGGRCLAGEMKFWGAGYPFLHNSRLEMSRRIDTFI